MMLQLRKAHWPVTTLGFGRRVGIWLQGCSIGCPGCCSRDMWSSIGGATMSVSDLVSWCGKCAGDQLDGITISGGEPFEQAEGLLELVSELGSLRQQAAREVDLLCYSGMPWRRLQKDHPAILDLLDVIVPEPFVTTLDSASLRGSINQPLIALSDLGRRRYPAGKSMPIKRLQIEVNEQNIWIIGIPEKGDLERIEQHCQANGLDLGQVSWRS